MKKDDFWFISLCVLFIFGFVLNWNIYIRIAVIANAIVVLINVLWRGFSWLKEKRTHQPK